MSWQELAKTLTPTGAINEFGARMITEVPLRHKQPIRLSESPLKIATLQEAMVAFEKAKNQRALVVCKEYAATALLYSALPVVVDSNLAEGQWSIYHYYTPPTEDEE